MRDAAAIRDELNLEGRVWLRHAVPAEELLELRHKSTAGAGPGARIGRSAPLFEAVAATTASQRIAAIWPGMQPVRVVSFDKSETANWGLPWHQDRVISVAQRADIEGYSNWSLKVDTWHCEPPLAVLESMLFVRLHLDPQSEANGAMEIALRSHRLGLVPSADAAAVADRCEREITTAEAGDVLILAMLTLHRSRPAPAAEGPRRALRVDYASAALAVPLRWA